MIKFYVPTEKKSEYSNLIRLAKEQSRNLAGIVRDDEQAIALKLPELHALCVHDALKATSSLTATLEKITNLVQPTFATA